MGFSGKNELINVYRKDAKSDAACAVSDLGLDNLLFLLIMVHYVYIVF